MDLERICRLCLKSNDSFKAIEGDMKDVLKKFLPQIDLVEIEEPLICTNCAEMLIRCVDFKATCLHVHDYIVSFMNKENVKLDLKDIYLGKNENDTCVPEDQDICGFCIGPVENCSAISLDVDKRGQLGTMINRCLPELDLSIIKKPVICAACHGTLKNWFRFVTNCLTVEEKIKEYRETLDTNNKGQIQLSNLLQFTARNITSEVDDNWVEMIKVGNQLCEEVEHKIKNFMDMDHGVKINYEEQLTSKNMLFSKEESHILDGVKTEEAFCGENKQKEHLGELDEDQKCLLNEEIEIKTEEPDFVRPAVGLQQPDVTTRLMPNFEAEKLKSYIEQTFMNRNVSTITTYQCQMYKCDYCVFQTKHKNSLKIHLLKHKDPSEITMYKCDSCLFQTKHKHNLKHHALIHSQATYKCDFCMFQTKHKYSLKMHLLNHKNPSETTVYKCDFCLYQTIHKHYLKSHLVLHKDPSEVTMYKCDSCLYQTKYKHNFKHHTLMHSQVEVYKCDLCVFQTKRKYCLKVHLLKHQNPSEVTTYKCDSCSYQTVHKYNLKSHFLIHSPVMTYKCDLCGFQTKHKRSLKIHLLKHENPSEVTMNKHEQIHNKVSI